MAKRVGHSAKTKVKKTKNTAPPGKPLPAQMLDLITAYWVSQMVFVAARLGIADQLQKRARTPADLAAAIGVEGPRLHRILRALAAVGVVVEKAGGRYSLTPLGATLRSDAPFSMRNFALMMVDDHNWQAWGRLMDGVKEPTTPFEAVHNCKLFEYLHRHPDKLATFGASMSSISATENPAVAAAYDFDKINTLVDVGGSQGHLLAAVLARHRHLHGILFDVEAVIAKAQNAPYLAARVLQGRVQFMAGDFFTSVPQGADAYIMKYILHDWDDDQCVRILTHCRHAMAKHGHVLVVDTVIPPGNAPHWGKMLDINMLVSTGGRERTQVDFAALFQCAGLRLKKVHATPCPLSIVEAVA